MAERDFVGKTVIEIEAALHGVLREILDGGYTIHVSPVVFGYRNIGISLLRPRTRWPRARDALISFGCLQGFHKNTPKVEGYGRLRVRAFSG